MPLTAEQRKQLHETLTATFSEDELRQMLSFHLSVDLDEIVKPNARRGRVFDLITWAERQGCETELIAAAQNHMDDQRKKRKADAGAGSMTADGTPAQPTNRARSWPSWPSWLKWVVLVIAIPFLVSVAAGIAQLFAEYGYFIPAGQGHTTPPPTVQATPIAPTPVSAAHGLPTLDIAYGDSEQAMVDGGNVLVSVPANPNPYLAFAAPDRIEVVLLVGGENVTGTLRVGECLLAGGVTVTLLDAQGGANRFNRFAVTHTPDGAAAQCVNSDAAPTPG